MDAVKISAVLAVIAGGAGRALGAQLWAGVSALGRRRFLRDRSAVSSGEAQLATLKQALADQRRAMALAEVEARFGQVLAARWQRS